MMTRCTSLLFALLAGAGFLPSAYAVDDYWMADRYAVKLSFDAGEPGDRGKMNEPTVLSVPMPYPGELLASGLEGMVRVSYTVLEDGSVTDVKVLKSWLNDFEKPTLEAIRKWRFHPAVSVATKKPVRATMLCEVEFEPEEDASVLDWKPGPSALAAKDAVRVFFDQEGKVLHCAADSLDGWLTVILSGRITISSWRLKDLVLPVDIDHDGVRPKTLLFVGKECVSRLSIQTTKLESTGVLNLDPHVAVSFPWKNMLAVKKEGVYDVTLGIEFKDKAGAVVIVDCDPIRVAVTNHLKP